MIKPELWGHPEIVRIAKKTFSKYDYESHYHDFVNFYHLHKISRDSKKSSAVMLSEKITLCEVNAELWDKAICSATYSVTKDTYSHYITVQKFINYLLNADSSENFGLIENFFWKLLITHPPNSEMFDYYWQILFDEFVCVNGKETKNQPLLFCLLELITKCLKDENHNVQEPATKMDLAFETKPNSSGLNLRLRCCKAREKLNITTDEAAETKVNQKQMSFDILSWKEKINRCLIVLNFVHKILETDFIFWLHSEESKSLTDKNRPLLLHLFWKNQRDFGLINNEIQKLLQVYKLAVNLDLQNMYVIDKFLSLIGETIRWSDSIEETKYPFVGTKSISFIRELSFILQKSVLENKNNEKNKLLMSIKPPWLRLFLCTRLLTIVTRHKCCPELTAACEILEYIIKTENENLSNKKTEIKSTSVTNPSKQKKGKLKNENSKQKNSKTPLHVACQNNYKKQIKRLLTTPELDVNATDSGGWTALHIAAYKGKTTIVQELLSFSPKPESSQKPFNTRAQTLENMTPLMIAASQGHANVCELLLQHSGSILLEDVNKLNQTALELSDSSEVKEILKYYKNNYVLTENSFIEINFDLSYKKVVIELCVEMIHAYFSTFKTWKIFKAFKVSEKPTQGNSVTDKDEWDCMCYERDFKNNINKLKNLIPQLELIHEFKNVIDIYKASVIIK